MSVPIENVTEELQHLSGQLSELSRTVSLAVLALVWVFLAGGENTPTLPNTPDRAMVMWAGLLGLAALLFDLLQYIFGYVNVKHTLDEAERLELEVVEYEYESAFYRLRTWSFWIKLFLCIGSFVVLCTAILRSM